MSAYLYGANTLGALAGTLTAGFFLLPYFGVTTSTLLTAALNVAIGVGCVTVGRGAVLPRAPEATQGGEGDRGEPAGRQEELDPLPGLGIEARRRLARAAVLAFGISGFGSFALEVVWTRIMLISASATVYAFTAMLSCFLFGIFLGSYGVAKLADRSRDPIRLFSWMELGVGASVAILALVTSRLPELFGAFLGAAIQLAPGGREHALVLATLALSGLLLVVPTTLLGATFPVALRLYTTNVRQIGSRAGSLYAANTLGAVLGSLCAGLVMIPTLGTRTSLVVLAILFAANGVYLALADRADAPRGAGLGRRIRPAMAAAIVGIVAACLLALAQPYRVTLNFNQRAGVDTELLYHGEGVQSTVDVVRSRSGVTSLILGGNVEADDGPTQMRHFVLKGHLPLMFLEQPKEVLVIGLGMGITLRSTARHEGVESIRVVELSPEVVEAQEHLKEVNGDILADPLVHLRIDDGRNFLEMTDHTYDMITADPIHPKISRVGYLYTREYYEMIRDRLTEGGVVCQWMPIYQISPERLRSAMKTFVEVFPHATLWYVKNHALFVAKRDSPAIDYPLLARKLEHPRIAEDMASIGIRSPEDFLGLMLMGPDQIRAFVDAEGEAVINSDTYPYLEYFVPRDLFYLPIDNVRQMVEHPVDPSSLVEDLPPGSAERIQQLVDGRSDRLVDELLPGRGQ
ncbi:MAG: fused MFS/spermidine synthase, partial [Holophagales bacterium]|nr:fused MFS/spermidine synthase [Holophagales bacterium]